MSPVSDKLLNKSSARIGLWWGALLLILGLTASADQSVSLSWDPSTDSNVVGYKIYYGGVSRVYTNVTTFGVVTNVTISGLTPGSTYYFAATTLGANGAESPFSNEAIFAIPQTSSNLPAANPPVFDTPANLTVFQGAASQMVVVTNIDSGLQDGNQNLTVSATTSDSTIISTPVVSYTTGNNYASLNVVPAGALGTATVTVTVNNGAAGNNVTSQTFTVTVVPPLVVTVPVTNQPPTFDALTNLAIYANAGTQTVTVTNINSGLLDGNQNVSVSAEVSDPTILSAPTVLYTNGNNFATVSFAPVSGAVGSATVTVIVNNGAATNNQATQTFTVTVISNPAVNQPPTLDAISNITVLQNSGTHTIPLTGISSGSPTENQLLRVTAISSNPKLVPTPIIRYSSPATNGLLLFRAGMGTGSAMITVTVNDGGKSNNLVRQSFKVTVRPNQPPTLDPIASLTIPKDSGSQVITLTGISSGSPAETQTLRVGATSSKPGLVLVAGIQYTSPASTALLTLKPSGNSTGSAMITVTVNDGGLNNNTIRRTFLVNVTAVTNMTPVAAVSAQVVVAQTNSVNRAATLTALASAKRGQFSFQVTGVAGGNYVVQASSDLIHWTTLQTNTAPFTVQDETAGQFSQRFYRTYSLDKN